MAPLVILDRDGVLNVDRTDSVTTPDQLEMIPGAAAAVARLNRAGFKVALATNQANVGRGLLSAQTLVEIQNKLEWELARHGAHLDAYYICPDAPEAATSRRKPGPGMLLEALREFDAVPAETWMIGDDVKDLQAARAAGCYPVLVLTGKGKRIRNQLPLDLAAVPCYADLEAAVDARLQTAGLTGDAQ